MSDHTPETGEARNLYADGLIEFWGSRETPMRRSEAVAEFDRFVSKVKADALREWARLIQSELEATASGGIDLGENYLHGANSMLRQADEYADRIEGEA